MQVYRNRHYMNSKNIPPDHDDDEDALWKSAFDRLPDESVDDFCDQLSTKSEQCSEHLGVYYPAYYAGLCESISGDSDIQYADPSLSIQALKKIFKHPFNPDQTLDLHHLRGHEAYNALVTLPLVLLEALDSELGHFVAFFTGLHRKLICRGTVNAANDEGLPVVGEFGIVPLFPIHEYLGIS